jgi:predicted deacylase
MYDDQFSHSYAAARRRFRDNAVRAGARLSTTLLPFATGRDGEALATDIAWLGPEAPRGIVIVTAGTHGIEGYAGSGFQCSLLSEAGARLHRERIGLVLVHAVNPYGFSYGCRVNEDNIDLNRNFMDFAKPLPAASAIYERLHAAIVPPEWSEPQRRGADRIIHDAWIELGERDFQDGVCHGQYTYPDGLFYGGRAASWSNSTWRTFLAGLPRSAKYVTHIDLHTGLGPFGYGEILFPLTPDSPSRAWACEWYEQLGLRTAGSRESSAYTISGAMNQAVLDSSAQRQSLSITLEFGTVEFRRMFAALRADNWLRLRAPSGSPGAAEIHEELRECFYPSDSGWKASVVERCNQVLTRTVDALEERLKAEDLFSSLPDG